MIDPLCIIQARLNSTRLPDKMLLPLQGQSLLMRAIIQAANIYGPERVVVAAPLGDRDRFPQLPVGVFYFGGNENDLVSRFWYAAHGMHAKNDTLIIRWTPDDWRKDDALIRLATFRGLASRIPAAQSIEAFPMHLLDMWYWTKPMADREHIGTLLGARDPLRPIDTLPWSIDTQEDYDAVVKVVGA